jgi:dephospho-CoA kinase
LQFIRDNNKQLLCSIEKEFNVSFDGENVSTGDIIEFDVHRFQLILINDERITCKVEKNIKWKIYWYLFKRIIYEKIINNKQHVILDFDMLLKFDSINVICFPIVSICNTEKDLVLTRIRNKYNYDYQSSFEVYSNQITVEEYNLKSEKVIHNEGTIDELYRKIDRFMHNMFV